MSTIEILIIIYGVTSWLLVGSILWAVWYRENVRMWSSGVVFILVVYILFWPAIWIARLGS